jgi:hypothetical protein
MAEKMERRRLAKGNRVEQNKGRTLCRETLQSELNRIRQLAEKDRSIKASARYYLRQEPSAVVPHAWDLCGGCRVTGIPTVTVFDSSLNQCKLNITFGYLGTTPKALYKICDIVY